LIDLTKAQKNSGKKKNMKHFAGVAREESYLTLFPFSILGKN